MQTQKGMITLLVGLICVLALFLMTQKPPGAAEDKPAPDAPLMLDPNGPPVMISSLRGKVVVLDLWATWCGPCRMSMPELEKIYQKYRGKDVEVIGVSADDPSTQPQIPAVKQALGVTYPTVIGDKTPSLLKNYSASGLPMLYVIDKQGNIRLQEAGFDSVNGLAKADKLIDTLLKE